VAIARVGCAGWSLPSAVAAEFPAGGSHLERYAQRFSCVEINSSFYRPHQEKTYRRWAASVPAGFAFSAKIPRSITHEQRLEHCEEVLRRFLAEVAGLGEKLGCLLIQLPPSLALEPKLAGRFFSLLRTLTAVPAVCEPRHASWFTERGAEVLAAANVGWVSADPAPVSGRAALDTAGILYLRLHGSPRIYQSSYDEPFIATTAERMECARTSGGDAWCIFDNTAHGAAVPNALSLASQLKHPGSS